MIVRIEIYNIFVFHIVTSFQISVKLIKFAQQPFVQNISKIFIKKQTGYKQVNTYIYIYVGNSIVDMASVITSYIITIVRVLHACLSVMCVIAT